MASASTRHASLPRSSTQVYQDKPLCRSASKTSHPTDPFPSTSMIPENSPTQRLPLSMKQKCYLSMNRTPLEDADSFSTRRMEFSNSASSFPTSIPKFFDGATILKSNGIRDTGNSGGELGVRAPLAKRQIKYTSNFSLKTPKINRTPNYLRKILFHPRIVHTKNGRSIQIGVNIGFGGAQIASHSPLTLGWLQRIFGIRQLRGNGLQPPVASPLQTVHTVRRTTASASYYHAIYSTNYL